jgi:hypothetical protein
MLWVAAYRAAVEAVPAKPDEDSADEDKRGVVRSAVDFVALVQSLSEHKGVGESRPSRGNVNGSAAGEVERREVE